MLKSSFIARSYTGTGGGSKAVALWAKQLSLFNAEFITSDNAEEFRDIYGLNHKFNIVDFAFNGAGCWDKDVLKKSLLTSSIILSSVPTLREPQGYYAEYDIARELNIPIMFDCVFGIGSINNYNNCSFAVTPSTDALREIPIEMVGEKCVACYLPVPEPNLSIGRLEFRKKYNIPQDCFLIGHPCFDKFPFVSEQILSAVLKETNAHCVSTVDFDLTSKFHNCGRLKQKDMGDFYDACDAILHCRSETFGYNIQQASMMKKPIVLYWNKHSFNAPAEFLYPNGGYISQTAGGCVKAIKNIIFNRDIASERAHIAYYRVFDNCNVQTQGAKIESLMLRSITGKPSGSEKILLDTDKWFKEQKQSSISWRSARINLEDELNKKEFI